MTEYDNTNRITIFKNKEKKSEKSPDWTGRLFIGDDVIDGLSGDNEVRVAIWKMTSKAGDVFLSGSIQLPNEDSGNKPVKKKPQAKKKVEESFDDEEDLY